MTSENVASENTATKEEISRTISGYNNHLIMAPVAMILIAELLIFLEKPYLAIWMHILTAITLALSTIKFKDPTVYRPLQALMLLPLLRLVNISMPVFFDLTLYSFVLIYTPLIIPIFLVAIHQRFTKEQIGFTLKGIAAYIPLAVLAGFIIAQGEYHVITANYLIPDLSFGNILKLSIVMILFVGLIEELIFRSILQTRLEESFGMQQGLVITSILFGIMHSGYATPYEILFTAFAGLTLGFMFQRTRSLPLITITHGFVNIFLFGLIPHLGPGLGIF